VLAGLAATIVGCTDDKPKPPVVNPNAPPPMDSGVKGPEGGRPTPPKK
jgi:hypothetical protein